MKSRPFAIFSSLRITSHKFYSAISPAVRVKCILFGNPDAFNGISDLSAFWAYGKKGFRREFDLYSSYGYQ